MKRGPLQTAEVIELPKRQSPEEYPADKNGIVIPLYLPDNLHQGSGTDDARAQRYDLSADGLEDYEVTALTSVIDPFYDRDDTTDAACDYAYLLAKNELVNGADLDTVLAKIGSYLTMVADDELA